MSSLKTTDGETSLLLRGNKLTVYLSPNKSNYVRVITDILTDRTEFTSTTRIDISEVRCICKIDEEQIRGFTGRSFSFSKTHLKSLLVVFTSNWCYFIEASLVQIERLKYPNMVRINNHCMINVKYCNLESANSVSVEFKKDEPQNLYQRECEAFFRAVLKVSDDYKTGFNFMLNNQE